MTYVLNREALDIPPWVPKRRSQTRGIGTKESTSSSISGRGSFRGPTIPSSSFQRRFRTSLPRKGREREGRRFLVNLILIVAELKVREIGEMIHDGNDCACCDATILDGE